MTHTSDVVPMALRHVPPVSLDALIATADLQTRRDRKYLLPPETAAAVLRGVSARALEIDGCRTFRYESIYFDTTTWDSYLSAARRRPRRFKVRTRAYLDSGECMLEVKVRDNRGNTVKHRRPYELHRRDQLTGDVANLVWEVEASAPYADRLHPVLTVAYERSTLVLDTSDDRVTIDMNAAWSSDDDVAVRLTRLALIETKTSGPPCEVDRALWRLGHRPVTISKYCTGLAAVRPELPSNKWHRVLARHLLPNLDGLVAGRDDAAVLPLPTSSTPNRPVPEPSPHSVTPAATATVREPARLMMRPLT